MFVLLYILFFCTLMKNKMYKYSHLLYVHIVSKHRKQKYNITVCFMLVLQNMCPHSNGECPLSVHRHHMFKICFAILMIWKALTTTNHKTFEFIGMHNVYLKQQ